MRRFARSFQAVDPNGNVVTINVFQHFEQFNNSQGYSEQPTITEVETARGSALNRIAKGVYETVMPPVVRLTSDDPNAE